MKYFKYIFIILVVFSKTGNVLSDQSIFNVNNIEVVKKPNFSNEQMANQAIKKGFKDLTEKILVENDIKKISKLNINQIKKLVSYYQLTGNENSEKTKDKIFFNIFFDKDKLYDLFYKNNILYSEVINKELYFLPILIQKDKIFIFSQNYFYENWNKKRENTLIEFILPLENIEIIQKINSLGNQFFQLNLIDIFREYENNNLALVFIDKTNPNLHKIFLKFKIFGKKIDKNISIKNPNLSINKFNEKTINIVSNDITNLVKSQNLIDIRTPSFLNTKLVLGRKNSLIELKNRLQSIDLIENIYVQEFNSEYVLLKIKYLGKLDKIINQLKEQKIILNLSGENWSLKII